jgi:exodeoxyribonuclease VII large subunit
LQFYAVEIEARGKGALTVAFEQLKKRLWQEGLFDDDRKKPLPSLPQTIGIVTSLHGAAVRDMLRIIDDRFPDRRVVIRPVRVQGPGAADEIAQGIRELECIKAIDVMIVGRGGGSLEDLWAFNEEVVARAIAAARVPIVSAVGHEIDITIADFVADRRATTPTSAAEMILPNKDDVVERVVVLKRRLQRAIDNGLQRRRENLRHWTQRLADPSRGLRQGQVRLDDLSLRLWRRQEDSNARLRERLGHLAGRLESVNPLAVLRRGYSIVYGLSDGSIIKEASSLRKGHRVKLEFATGRAVCRVEEVEE